MPYVHRVALLVIVICLLAVPARGQGTVVIEKPVEPITNWDIRVR